MTIALAILGFFKKIPAWVYLVIVLGLVALYVWYRVAAHLSSDAKTRADLAADQQALAVATAQLRADTAAFGAWKAYATQIEAQRVLDQTGDTSSLTQANQFATTQAAQAYRLGRASCGKTNAQAPSVPSSGPMPAGVAVPGGVPVDDLRTASQPGAFTPAH
jgi:Na+-transporting NADH:ubiquinone oxidoreductase subunit NqrC